MKHTLFAILLFTAAAAFAQNGTVLRYQKVSDTQGSFTGTLDNSDAFGVALTGAGDINGDGIEDVIAGARLDDDGGTDRGAVWVLFMAGDGEVASFQKISDTDGNFSGILDDNDYFGRAVAALGDLDGDGVNDIAVGAYGDDDGGTDRGAVWILFLNANGTVKSHRKISDTQGGFTGTLADSDIMGYALAAPGDINNDGIPDLVAGALGDDDGGNARGAAWILFLNADGTVSGQQKISDTAGNFTGTLDDADQFGCSVTGVSDLNGDGVPDICVGAFGDDDGGDQRGAAWVLFLHSDGTVESHQKISDTAGGFTGTLDDVDRFGFTVAGIADADGNGVRDLVAGAYLDDDGGANRGALWVLFLESDGTVKSYQKISDTQGAFTAILDDSDGMGLGVGSADLNGDLKPELLAGAYADDDGGANRGAFYVIYIESDRYSGIQTGYGKALNEVKISDTQGSFTGTLNDGDNFGYSGAGIGDLDGDGVNDIAVGAFLDEDGGTDRGAVWILFLNAAGTVKSYQKISDTQGGFTGTLDNADQFGYAVASLGDLDGDGNTDIAVGARLDDDGSANTGAVWILFLNANGTVKSHQKISATQGDFSGNIGGSQFGASVASASDVDGDGIVDLAVGALTDGDGGTDRGAVWVLFLGADGKVDGYQKISDTQGGFTGTLDDGDNFGSAVTGIGDLDNNGVPDIAVGAYKDDDGGTDHGAFWVLFLNSNGTVSSHKKISDTQGGFIGLLDNSDLFGSALANLGDIDGDGVTDIAAGMGRDDDGGTDRGAVWVVFMKSNGTAKSFQKISGTKGGFNGSLDNGDLFGYPVFSAGDLNGDNRLELVAGASADDDGGTDRGALYIMSLETEPLTATGDTIFWIASAAGEFGSTANWSRSSGGSAHYTIPGPKDVMVFNGSGTANIAMDRDARVAGIRLQSGYTGTLQSAYRLTVGDSGVTVSAGSLKGGSNILNIGGPFTLNGGTWTEETSTVHFTGATTQTIGANDTLKFYNLAFSGAGKKDVNEDLKITGTLTLTGGEVDIDTNSIWVTATAAGAVDYTAGLIRAGTGGKIIRNTAAASWYLFPLMTKKQYPDTFVVKIKPSTASARQFEAATSGTGGIITAFDMATMGAETTGMQAVRNFNDTVQLRYTTNATDSIITVEVYSVAGAAYVTLDPGFYTVSPKNTLTLHSLHSIMAWYGLNTFSQISASGGNTCANWEYTVTFGQNNAVTSESVAYSDYLGRPCQGQARNLTENTVLTTRSVFDAYGRPMLTSLPAPTGSYFNYMSGFIKDASGGAYTYADYDTKTTLNSPAAVQSTVAGTLGNFYSSGGIEAYVPETSYPFVRTEALSSGTRNAAAGEQYRMGNANNSESKTFTMTAPGDELEKIFGTDSTWRAQVKTDKLENKSVKVTGGAPSVKTVTIDADGREVISYSAGGNAVASCYSGLGGCGAHAVTHTMLFDGTRTIDIHIPAAKVDSVKLPLPLYGIDAGLKEVHADSIQYTLTDIETNYVLQPTTDYTIDGNRWIDFTATNGYSSGTHFLRVSFDYTATFYDLSLNADTPNANIQQRLDYSDWSAAYYDLAGNLRKSVSPKGINCSSPGTITMATTYDYSPLGRLIGKKSPDEGTVEMVYDSEGKLRFSQHDEQGTGRFSYINYDKHGRVVESGEYTTANGGHFFENYYKNNDVPACGPCYGTSGILDDLDSLDNANCDFVTTMQYDTACTAANAIPSGYTYGSSYAQHYTTGQVTKTSNDETDTWYGYDQLGRLAWMAQQLKDADYTAERTATDQQIMTLDYTYALTGQVTKVEYNKNVSWEKLTHNYTYDDDLRLSNVTTDTDVLTAEQIATYQYYLTGALKRKELGNNLQGLDYIYTINGQLKSINHPSLDPEKDPGKDGAAGGSGSGRDVFGMSIDYHTDDYTRTGSNITSSSTASTSHYNGLIDAVRWKVLYEPDIIKAGAANETLISSTADEVMYRYHYNAFNWLDSARFGVYNTATPAFTLKDAYKLWGDDANTAIQYDDNGNIENLKRNGYSGGDPGGLVMDEFNYTYTANTNKLASILDDAITSYTNDFDAATTKNFTYNAIGQMTASEAEGIDEVAYIPSGKVKYVAYSNNDTAFYWYNDKGQKYKSQLKPNGGSSVFTWYVSDAAGNIMGIYSFTEGGDSIKLAEQPVYADGRVGILHPAQDSVVYEVTDHQGNVRVAFTEHGDSTHIVAWTDFYPFGSPMPGRYENSSDYRYGYQGQEKMVGDDENTGWDHFELRMYNGQLGRFISPDPYGQFHSPYIGMGNSPVNGADPTGGYMAFGVDNVGGYAESVRQRMEWREFVRFKDFMYQNGGGFYNPVTGQMDYKGQSAEQLYHLGMRAPNDWGRSGEGYNKNLNFGQMAERQIDQLESKYTRYTSEWIDARRAIMDNYTAASQHGRLIPDREEEGPVNRLNDEMPVVDDIDYNRLAIYQGMREAGARWRAERNYRPTLEVVQGIAVGKERDYRANLVTSTNQIVDIFNAIHYAKGNNSLKNLYDILVPNQYGSGYYNTYSEKVIMGGHTFQLGVLGYSESVPESYYDLYQMGFGYLDRFTTYKPSTKYNGGFYMGFYLTGYERQYFITIGANTKEGYEFLKSLYKK